MIYSYLKIAIRNILRHKLVSAITILGLSLGLAGSMFIFLWVSDELNFDRFNKQGDRLYRVEEDQPYSNGIFHVTVTPWPSGPVWKEKIPEVEASCRVTSTGSLLFRHDEKLFYEDKTLAADTSFFSMFTYPLIRGNKHTALTDPLSIVISEKMAAKYFGTDDPIGKTLQVNNQSVYKVTAIMKDMPSNSSFDADFIIPFEFMKKSTWYSESWSNNSISTYLLLAQNSSAEPVNKKLTAVVKEHNTTNTTQFVLFPYLRMHLHSYWGFNRSPGAIVNIWIFSSIAILVLIIACINFMNLSTARSASRAKETGLRKLNGAYKSDAVIQFFGESFLHAFAGMVVAFLLVALLLGPFNTLAGKEFILKDIFRPGFIISIFAITALTGFFAGIYPAFILSSFKPIDTLKSGKSGGSKGGLFRKVTVVVQFCISIVLILFTIVTYKQLGYMQSKSLGFDKENLLYVPLKGSMSDSYHTLKDELSRNPEVIAVTGSTNPPQNIGSNADNIWWEGKAPDSHTLVNMAGIDFGYIETMNISMKSGRPFSKAYSIDTPHDSSGTFLINEQLEKLMGSADATGKLLKFGSTRGQIVGVMKDFNFQSLRSKVEPLALWIWPEKYLSYLFIRVKPGNLHQTVAGLESDWKKILPQYPFDIHFIDQDIEKTYKVEEQMGSLLKAFSILAILIACIGLFGLASYTVEQRTRELGLRKVLGATGISIFALISGEFLKLLLVAAVISLPISIYSLHRFLSNYAYHVDLAASTFITALLLSVLVALVAISYQLFTAINTNPARSLKYE